MTTFPVVGFLSDAAREKGEMKDAFEALVAAAKQIPGAGIAETELTIASGAVTPIQGVHTIDTEADAATDDLTTIATGNLPDGSFLWIRAVSAARVVTVKHNAGGAGQIALRASVDMMLTSTTHWLLLTRTGANWEELGHFTNVADRMPVLAKTSAYTLSIADNAKMIDATSGTFTLTLPTAASAGDGFFFALKVGSGTITIDPAAAELIDGAATLALAPGDAAIIVGTGAAWRTLARYVAAPVAAVAAAAKITLSGGTPSLAGAINIASITDNGVGDYTLNFTTAFADTNYKYAFGEMGGAIRFATGGTQAAGSFRYNVLDAAGNPQDSNHSMVFFT